MCLKIMLLSGYPKQRFSDVINDLNKPISMESHLET